MADETKSPPAMPPAEAPKAAEGPKPFKAWNEEYIRGRQAAQAALDTKAGK